MLFAHFNKIFGKFYSLYTQAFYLSNDETIYLSSDYYFVYNLLISTSDTLRDFALSVKILAARIVSYLFLLHMPCTVL